MTNQYKPQRGLYKANGLRTNTLKLFSGHQRIELQERHHRKATFEDEFLGFLKAHEIQHDERRLWA